MHSHTSKGIYGGGGNKRKNKQPQKINPNWHSTFCNFIWKYPKVSVKGRGRCLQQLTGLEKLWLTPHLVARHSINHALPSHLHSWVKRQGHCGLIRLLNELQRRKAEPVPRSPYHSPFYSSYPVDAAKKKIIKLILFLIIFLEPSVTPHREDDNSSLRRKAPHQQQCPTCHLFSPMWHASC